MIEIHAFQKENTPKITQWFYNPVALFLAAPEQNYPLQPATIEALFTDGDRQVFVMCKDATPIGCIALATQSNTIEFLFVEPKYRGQKHSKRLVEHLLNLATHPLAVWVHKQQREQRKLFRSLGFIATENEKQCHFEGKSEAFIELMKNE